MCCQGLHACLRARQGMAAMAAEGTWKAYFRGNGANVVKNVPETAIKMGFNDRIKALVVKDGHSITLGAPTGLLTCKTRQRVTASCLHR